jgi:hypothetical protein
MSATAMPRTKPRKRLLGRCQAQVTGRRKFRFKNKLASLDSTVIDLCATVFDRAKFRRTKGGVRLGVRLTACSIMPATCPA